MATVVCLIYCDFWATSETVVGAQKDAAATAAKTLPDEGIRRTHWVFSPLSSLVNLLSIKQPTTSQSHLCACNLTPVD